MSYSINSESAVKIAGDTLSTQIITTPGAYSLLVTGYDDNDSQVCSASVSFNVVYPPISSQVPADATSVRFIEQLSNWAAQHDPGTGSGATTGVMSLVGSPALSPNSRQFVTGFSNSGGELYHVSWGSDETATNFFYDGWVYLTSSANSIANLEMDMNQVISNGDTIIYGFQCDGYSGTWDYTENAGTPNSPVDKWIHSNASCNVRNWSQNVWHHIQISYSRDDSGNVTYNSVWLDGNESLINKTVPSEFALGWASVLLTNFQIDGLNTGTNTTYLNELTISRW